MLLAAMMLLTMMPTTQAAPINPATVWGSVFIGGVNQSARAMTVWIDGQAYGTNVSWNGGTGWYIANMVCAGDDVSYAVKEGGLNGDRMYYTVDDTGPYMADNTYPSPPEPPCRASISPSTRPASPSGAR